MTSAPTATIQDTGEPACKTTAELNQRYRHNWDPTVYWECLGSLENQRAQLKHCPPNQLYMNKVKSCVDWKDWSWTEAEPESAEKQESKGGK